MPKPSKTFLALIFSTIVLLTLCTSFLPAAHAAEPSIQEKSLSILSDVVGLKTEQYTLSKSTQKDDKLLDASQKMVDLRLTSAGSTFRVTCSYVKDVLALVYLSDQEGILKMKQPTINTVDAAKDLLSSYQRDSGDAAYGEFASMLNGVDVGEDVTKVAGDVQLKVSNPQQNTTSYRWTYIDRNGVLAERKNVILTYEYGMLKAFYNNWPLYTIAHTENKLSAMEASEIAITASKSVSYPVTDENGTAQTVSLSDLTVAPKSLEQAKLIYVNSVEQKYARGGDPFEMYLAWCVPLGFDKFYPGGVCGLAVILWADTGEVCGINQMVTDSSFFSSVLQELSGGAGTERSESMEQPIQSSVQQQTSQQQASKPTQFLGVYAAVGMVFVLLSGCKVAGVSGNKRRPSKFRVILLCGLIVSNVAVFVVPQVKATTPAANSRIYAGPDAGAYNNDTVNDYERAASLNVCGNISEMCKNNGYPGDLTSNEFAVKEDVLVNVFNDQYVYDGTMVFYIGHQMGNNRIQDNYEKVIEQSEVLANTSLGKNFFVFLWVCGQAPPIGDEPDNSSMATAWLHRDGSPGHPTLDADGFGSSNSDGKGQCYIGFSDYSPMVSTAVNITNGFYYPFMEFGASFPCEQFITDFYNYTLNYKLSVCDALDHASWHYFGCDYLDTVLNTGYNCWNPGIEPENEELDFIRDPGFWPFSYQANLTELFDGPWPNCTMRVLGDSNIKLRPLLTVNAYRIGSPVSVGVKIDGESVGTSGNGWRVTPGEHEVEVDAQYGGYDLMYYGYDDYAYYTSSITVDVTSDATVNAYYSSNFPPYGHCLMIYVEGVASGATTYPEPGVWHESYGETINATALCDETCAFDYWILDEEEPCEDNPLPVEMWDGDHELTAYFLPLWNLTITAGEGGTTDPAPGTHQYLDGMVVGVSADADQGSSFSYWLLDEEWVYTNETVYFDMDAHRTLEAHFDEDLPTCEVMVYAFEYSTQEFVYPDVYVDGDWAGTAWDPFEVEVGEHDFEVDGNAEFPYGLAWFWFFEIDNDEYEDNPLEWTFNTLQLEVEAVYIASK